MVLSHLRINIDCGRAEERILLTGLHAVADISCSNCKTTLGWKYVSQNETFLYKSCSVCIILYNIHVMNDCIICYDRPSS